MIQEMNARTRPDLSSTLGWRLTRHASARSAERGVATADVLLTVAAPEFVVPGREGRVIFWRDGVKVVADCARSIVITVATTPIPAVAANQSPTKAA